MLAEIAVPWSNIGLRLQPDAGARWSAVVSSRHDAPLGRQFATQVSREDRMRAGGFANDTELLVF